MVVIKSSLQRRKLVRLIAVVNHHGVPHPDKPVVLEPVESTHSLSSSNPVGTSAEHIGQVATAISPTTNENSHSGH